MTPANLTGGCLDGREAFEAWAGTLEGSDGLSLVRHIGPGYFYTETHRAWQGFKAGRASLSTSKQGGWQPIETAPKDGSDVLAVYGRQGNVMQIVRWNALHGFWQSKGEPEIGFTSNATGWMPLPPAPNQPGEQQ